MNPLWLIPAFIAIMAALLAIGWPSRDTWQIECEHDDSTRDEPALSWALVALGVAVVLIIWRVVT